MPAPESRRAIVIDEVTTVSPELVAAIAALVPQLSSSTPPPDAGGVAELLESPATTLLVARDGEGAVVGMLTLVVFRIPTGQRAWIEDVVVDAAARGAGAGAALVREAVRLAAARGARSVDLTSRPSREEANRLYESLGFARRETNVYRWTGDPAG
jgi:ribosomal protein S18 acetylase RimI-like enzyme